MSWFGDLWGRATKRFRRGRDAGAIIDALVRLSPEDGPPVGGGGAADPRRAARVPGGWAGDPRRHPGRTQESVSLPGGAFIQNPMRTPSRHEAMLAAIECLRGCGLSPADGDRVLADSKFKFSDDGASVGVKARYSYFRRVVMPWIADLVGPDGAALLLRGLHAEAADGLVVPRGLIEAAAALRSATYEGQMDWEIVHRRGEFRVEAGVASLSAAEAEAEARKVGAGDGLRKMKEEEA